MNGRTASWWETAGESVRCLLCPHGCVLPPGGTGRCGVRAHPAGRNELVSLNYGLVSSVAMDPVEKKPLYHWKPGSRILSLGTVGCSMDCPFCQNWEIARSAPSVRLSPLETEAIPRLAAEYGTRSVAFTYNEPLTWFEYMLEASKILRGKGMAAVLVSNGMITPSPLAELAPFISAANIDLKAFTREAYEQLGGDLESVKETIAFLIGKGVHVEVTFLLVPGINDQPAPFLHMVSWLSGLAPQPPLHISRYFPRHRWTRPATSLHLLREYASTARTHLRHVYVGNAGEESRTSCDFCGKTLLLRREYRIIEKNVDDSGRCASCGRVSFIVP